MAGTEYFDTLIRHAISAEFFGNLIADKTLNELDDLEDELEELILSEENYITKNAVNSKNRQADKKIKVFIIAVEKLIIGAITASAVAEKKWFSDFLKKYTAVPLSVPDNIQSLVEYSPYSKTNTVQSFLSELQNKLKNIISVSLKRGYVFGTNSKEITDTVKQELKTVSNYLSLNAQEATASGIKNAQRIIMQSNEVIFSGYRWCSILDSSTCISCGSLDGEIFKSIIDTPSIPLHDRCRCQIVPLFQDTEIPDENYSQWLKRQDNSTQRKILGKTRFNLYQQGMPVRRFVSDDKTRKLTLDEVFDREGIDKKNNS